MIFYCTLRNLLNSNGVVYVQQRGFGSFVRLHIQQQCSSQFITITNQIETIDNLYRTLYLLSRQSLDILEPRLS